MPQNHHMADLGVDDSRDEALAYMTRLTAGRTPADLLERYVDDGPGIVADLEKRTALRLSPMSWPDYHPEMDGAKASGRMLEPVLFDTKRLGPLGGEPPPAPGAGPAHHPAGGDRRLATRPTSPNASTPPRCSGGWPTTRWPAARR